ncbi:hypothetical protein MWU65_03225 [Cellulophaga sp. F20128]|uniref:hypothetical protein n=1 Tax=Cellulophaga sp. F20128 TaxID=2926413 RepID=UPI001FF1F786|nr:hypothetical protein [Cellulophaga sp. F20128]MCK0156174.1 hypothetical protein [Cellulophaga sp. F20128]
MKLIKRLFNFYIDASIHVALSVFCLLEITALLLNVSINQNLAFFIFFGTIACYNFIKYGVEAKKYVLVANKYHKSIQLVSVVALIIAGYFASFLNIEVWYGIAVLLVFIAFYALPVLPNARNLRSFGGLKIFMVAIVWAGTTVILPVLSSDMHVITWDVWIESFQRFIIVLVLLVPFEIRDLAFDAPELHTLPQKFGVSNTKTVASLCVLVLFFSTFLKEEVTKLDSIAKGILFLALGVLMYFTRRVQSKYFASFWIEAIPIFWLGIVYVLVALT